MERGLSLIRSCSGDELWSGKSTCKMIIPEQNFPAGRKLVPISLNVALESTMVMVHQVYSFI